MISKADERKIIALVPARNEEHAIGDFLRCTLELADFVVVADQSSDRTRSVAKSFDRVQVVENPGSTLDELVRQDLLLQTARREFGVGHVLLALDVDELFFPRAGEAAEVRESLKSVLPGTSILFDKPTLLEGGGHLIEYGPVFPLGFVDDGRSHSGVTIHGPRLPRNLASSLGFEACGFLHLDLFDLGAHHAKRCYYACVEKLGSGPATLRWKRSARIFLKRHQSLAQPCKNSWDSWFARLGIRLEDLKRPKPYWWDLETLRLFAQRGCRTFWWEDIWWRDWEALLRVFQERGESGLPTNIQRPLFAIHALRVAAIHSLAALQTARQAFSKNKK